ncbi:MAG TPA: ferredoxin [Gaiellaceae bacterium]
MYRIEIDPNLCSGFGACADLAPELFALDAGGTASVRVGESDDPRVLDAAAACPMGAISVIEIQAA